MIFIDSTTTPSPTQLMTERFQKIVEDSSINAFSQNKLIFDGEIVKLEDDICMLAYNPPTFGDCVYKEIFSRLPKMTSGIDYPEKYQSIVEKAKKYQDIEPKIYYAILKKQFQKNNMRARGSINPESDTVALNKFRDRFSTPSYNTHRYNAYLLAYGLDMTCNELETFTKKYLAQTEINIRDPKEVIFYWCLKDINVEDRYAAVNDLYEYYRKLPIDLERESAHTKSEFLNTGTHKLIRKYKIFDSETHVRSYLRMLKYFYKDLEAKKKERGDPDKKKEIKHYTETEVSTTLRQNLAPALLDLSLFYEYSDVEAPFESTVSTPELPEKLQRNKQDYNQMTQRPKDNDRKQDAAQEIDQNNSTNKDVSNLFSKPRTEAYKVYRETFAEYLTCGRKLFDSETARAIFRNIHFENFRLSHKKNGDTPVHRDELLLCQFLNLYAGEFDPIIQEELITNTKEITLSDRNGARIIDYQKFGNKLLKSCSMAPLYLLNPFELFLHYCLLQNNPAAFLLAYWQLALS